jgi:hypothetical protein
VFEASHVPLRLWLQAVHLIASSKKGISSNQLHRTLGVTLKTAWFMSQRIREAKRVIGVEPMGGAGNIVEADETYIGKLDSAPRAAVAVLATALEAHRRSRECREAILREGMTITGRDGQAKAHPLLAVERDARRAFLAAVRALGLAWEDRPVSLERWERHRDLMMASTAAGRRPDEWWLYERQMERPRDREADVLYQMGELDDAELAELIPRWRDHFDRANEPDFLYCTGSG